MADNIPSEKPKQRKADTAKLDEVVAQARRQRESREQDYRAQSLKIHPWVCGRCAREFNRENLQELTVHHRDHNHDNNPPDGSNWENLCIYCHENEHARMIDADAGAALSGEASRDAKATFRAFADLKDLLAETEESSDEEGSD